MNISVSFQNNKTEENTHGFMFMNEYDCQVDVIAKPVNFLSIRCVLCLTMSFMI